MTIEESRGEKKFSEVKKAKQIGWDLSSSPTSKPKNLQGSKELVFKTFNLKILH